MMNRSFTTDGVSRMSSGGDYDDVRSYSRPAASSYRDLPLTESYLVGSSSRYGAESGSYDRAYERDIVESIMQQRALQQQLSIRESQLALASSLLQQQQQQQQFKRQMTSRPGDYPRDFKRPRMDSRSQPRNRGRDSSARRRGPRVSGSQRSPRARHNSEKPKESYDPEKPTVDEEGKFHCKACKSEFKDGEELKKHKSSSEHKDRVASAQKSGNQSKTKSSGKEKDGKKFCEFCDVEVKMNFLQHMRLPFHKKRKVQVLKGCGWCGITDFKNFTEVLAHRSTDEHIKKQILHEKSDKTGNSSQRRHDDSRGSRSESKSTRVLEPMKVDLPPELNKYDPKVVVGQACVVPVSGWFCKLCNKFYNNETTAKETHCMSEPHFNSYKKFMYAKLKAKAEVERDAKEKAAAEGRKHEAEAEEKKAEPAAKTEPENEELANQEVAQEEAMEGVKTEGEEVENGEEEAEEEEEEGGEMDEAEEEYVDSEEVAAVEDSLLDASQDGAGDNDQATEADSQAEAEPMMADEGVGEEGASANVTLGEDEEETEEPEQKKATRAVVSSPARGRGRGAGSNRARRGRKVAK